MLKTEIVKSIIPSWDGVDDMAVPSYAVALSGVMVSVDGCTHVKKNDAPTHDGDYDVRCNSQGVLEGEFPLSDVTKVYIWGFGFVINGAHYECEAEFDNAMEIEITEDTEIVLLGANSK